MSAANSNRMLKRSMLPKLVKTINSPRNLSNYIVRQSPKMAVPIANYNYWTKYFNRRLIDFQILHRKHFYSTNVEEELVDSNTFEKVCEETLDSLTEYFEELIDSEPLLEKGDIIYGAGVLTVDLGKYGTYVINRQSPNLQIWLSSPISGPKRYDYSIKKDCWIYKHDGNTLHSLLEEELSSILRKDINISKGRSQL